MLLGCKVIKKFLIYNIFIFVFYSTHLLIFATYCTNMHFGVKQPFPPFAKLNNYS